MPRRKKQSTFDPIRTRSRAAKLSEIVESSTSEEEESANASVSENEGSDLSLASSVSEEEESANISVSEEDGSDVLLTSSDEEVSFQPDPETSDSESTQIEIEQPKPASDRKKRKEKKKRKKDESSTSTESSEITPPEPVSSQAIFNKANALRFGFTAAMAGCAIIQYPDLLFPNNMVNMSIFETCGRIALTSGVATLQTLGMEYVIVRPIAHVFNKTKQTLIGKKRKPMDDLSSDESDEPPKKKKRRK